MLEVYDINTLLEIFVVPVTHKNFSPMKNVCKLGEKDEMSRPQRCPYKEMSRSQLDSSVSGGREGGSAHPFSMTFQLSQWKT